MPMPSSCSTESPSILKGHPSLYTRKFLKLHNTIKITISYHILFNHSQQKNPSQHSLRIPCPTCVLSCCSLRCSSCSRCLSCCSCCASRSSAPRSSWRCACSTVMPKRRAPNSWHFARMHGVDSASHKYRGRIHEKDSWILEDPQKEKFEKKNLTKKTKDQSGNLNHKNGPIKSKQHNDAFNLPLHALRGVPGRPNAPEHDVLRQFAGRGRQPGKDSKK